MAPVVHRTVRSQVVINNWQNARPGGGARAQSVPLPGPIRDRPLHIAIDLDEVLCPFFEPFVRYTLRATGRDGGEGYDHPRLVARRLVASAGTYDFASELGLPRNDVQALIHEFYGSSGMAAIRPLPGAVRKVDFLSRFRGHRLSIVTGRQGAAAEATHRFLETHFPPRAFETVYFTNSYTDREVSKVDACLSIGADVLIDDLPKNCVQCSYHPGDDAFPRHKNIECILFGNYAWNAQYRDTAMFPWAPDWSSIH